MPASARACASFRESMRWIFTVTDDDGADRDPVEAGDAIQGVVAHVSELGLILDMFLATFRRVGKLCSHYRNDYTNRRPNRKIYPIGHGAAHPPADRMRRSTLAHARAAVSVISFHEMYCWPTQPGPRFWVIGRYRGSLASAGQSLLLVYVLGNTEPRRSSKPSNRPSQRPRR
jgi:hypothetical protein